MKIYLIIATLLFSAVTHAQEKDPVMQVIDQYMKVKDALVKSDATAAAKEAGLLLKILQSPKMDNLAMDIKTIAATKDLEKQRAAFASLSADMYMQVRASKIHTTLYYLHCQKYNNGRGASWLSKESVIRNPYYGNAMPPCGSIVETLRPK
ncbi:DUF3347 domain-containing protein [Flavihumibacter profundi]|uniref:DUF3347 domain-containing protein n=1 Tax=Flavihumibacter profundi TaxID=2716883 RepID=UPI001CC3BDEB|nr:DUF3347 domain-containing protein [Flavihumibacter profundi]MBZ5858380.1 DUF3347 domain-containing protein [Flavihumibacter profundi]